MYAREFAGNHTQENWNKDTHHVCQKDNARIWPHSQEAVEGPHKSRRQKGGEQMAIPRKKADFTRIAKIKSSCGLIQFFCLHI